MGKQQIRTVQALSENITDYDNKQRVLIASYGNWALFELETQCNYDEALRGFRSILDLISENPDKYESYLANTLGNISIAYLEKNEYERAIDYANQALTLHSKLREKHQYGRVLATKGKICLKQRKYMDAIPLFEEAISISIDKSDHFAHASHLLHLGIAFSEHTGLMTETDCDKVQGMHHLGFEIATNLGKKQLQQEHFEQLFKMHESCDKPEDIEYYHSKLIS